MILSRLIKPVCVLLGLLFGVMAGYSTAATIYSWTDENGTVHFTDQAQHDEATAFPLSVTEVASPDSMADPAIETPIEMVVEKPVMQSAATVTLVSPVHEQTIRDNAGIITIHGVTNRELNNKLNALLVLDGVVQGEPQASLTWQLDNIDRGSHALQIQLLSGGKVIASSETITVYLHRASLANKKPTIQPR